MNTIQKERETALPDVIGLDGCSPEEFVDYFRAGEAGIRDRLLTSGALKFSGVTISSVDTFQKTVDSIADKFLSYIDGNSPRTKLTGTVYTSTEYDPAQRITMHNELSYSARWPNKLFFTCLQPAASGGETLLADSRDILRNMDKSIVADIRKKGVAYIRNLHGGKGIGQSWQDTFETDDPKRVEAYCRSYATEFEWKKDGGIRLKQRSKGIIRHRDSAEEVWFNQVDQFHPYQLGEEVLDAMMAIYDTPEDFPIYVTFGDGTEIGTAMVREILDTIDKITIAPAWEKNELLIVDNELVCHGRNSFTGDRKVLVAMSE